MKDVNLLIEVKLRIMNFIYVLVEKNYVLYVRIHMKKILQEIVILKDQVGILLNIRFLDMMRKIIDVIFIMNFIFRIVKSVMRICVCYAKLKSIKSMII